MNKSAARHQRDDEEEDEQPEAKQVNLTAKSAEPDEDEMPGGRSEIAQLLKDMAEEPWQRMKWHDHDVRVPLLWWLPRTDRMSRVPNPGSASDGNSEWTQMLLSFPSWSAI